jgi:hypothetical protein
VVESGAEGVGFFSDAPGNGFVLGRAGLRVLQFVPQTCDEGEALGLVGGRRAIGHAPSVYKFPLRPLLRLIQDGLVAAAVFLPRQFAVGAEKQALVDVLPGVNSVLGFASRARLPAIDGGVVLWFHGESSIARSDFFGGK